MTSARAARIASRSPEATSMNAVSSSMGVPSGSTESGLDPIPGWLNGEGRRIARILPTRAASKRVQAEEGELRRVRDFCFAGNPTSPHRSDLRLPRHLRDLGL